jgi:hypothetical protein
MRTLLCLAILSLAAAAHAAVIGKATVTAEQAQVMSGKQVIATAKKGDTFDVTEEKGDWFGVAPSQGWIHKSNVRYEPGSPGAVPEPTGTLDLSRPWQRDWKEFAKAISPFTKRGAGDEEVTVAFGGYAVEWTGAVTEIKQPEPGGNAGDVHLALDPVDVPIGGQGLIREDSVWLTPTKDQWPQWSGIRVGTKVVFRTRFEKGGQFPPFRIFVGMGPNAGKAFLCLYTTGAEIVRVLGSGQAPPDLAGPKAQAGPAPQSAATAAGPEQGLPYLIKRDGEGPVRVGEILGMPSGPQYQVRIPVQFELGPSGKAQPFTGVMVVSANQDDGGRPLMYTVAMPTDQEGAQKQGHLVLEAKFTSMRVLKGSGQAAIYLVRRAEAEPANAKPISNTLRVPIIFGN